MRPGVAYSSSVLLVLASGLSCAGQAAAGNPQAQATVAPQAGATSAATKPPSYDVVTIRPNNQGPGSTRVSINMDVYAATNLSLVELMESAYDLRPGLLSGEPKWAESARFDIRAKILDADQETLTKLTPEDRRRMLRELLADRFHVQVHTEVKTLPVYELVQAKGGAKLTDIPRERRNDPFNDTSSGSWTIHSGRLTGHYLRMKEFADRMSSQLNRPVVDKTGMPGHYNFQLNWSRDDAPAGDEPAPPPLFTAMEEQLGLKLEAAKDPVQTVVVDHAEVPTEN